MAYIDGFVMAVPTANKQKFLDYAREFDPIFLEFGATRVLECWGDDVPHGKQTDFYRATQAQDGEVPLFSWIEWPDRATADAAWAAMMTEDHPDMADMPFDGARMFWGGFAPIVDLRWEHMWSPNDHVEVGAGIELRRRNYDGIPEDHQEFFASLVWRLA